MLFSSFSIFNRKKPTKPAMGRCNVCLKSCAKGELMCCKSCLTNTYCSVACQKVDWPIHRKVCKETRRQEAHLQSIITAQAQRPVVPKPSKDAPMRATLTQWLSAHLFTILGFYLQVFRVWDVLEREKTRTHTLALEVSHHPEAKILQDSFSILKFEITESLPNHLEGVAARKSDDEFLGCVKILLPNSEFFVSFPLLVGMLETTVEDPEPWESLQNWLSAI